LCRRYAEEVKAAFRKLAHEYHPDKASPEGRASAEFNFNKITAARNRLLGLGHHVTNSYAHQSGGGAGMGGGPGGSRAGGGMGGMGGVPKTRLTNVSFALVLMLPLALIGVVSYWAFPRWGWLYKCVLFSPQKFSAIS
jgi:hypothetical protein